MKEDDYVLCTNLNRLRSAEQQLRATIPSTLLSLRDFSNLVQQIEILIRAHEQELNRRMR